MKTNSFEPPHTREPMTKEQTDKVNKALEVVKDKIEDVGLDIAEKAVNSPAGKATVNKITGSIIRHLLSIASGILLSHGYMDASNQQAVDSLAQPLSEMATGAILGGLAHYLSIREKRRTNKP